MRNKIIDYRIKTTAYTKRVDMLISVNGEMQHHYITMDWLVSQADTYKYMEDYASKLGYKNLTDEEQQNNIKMFGGVR